MDIFSKKLSVRFGDIDKSDTLTAASAFDFFQEAAMSHAEILGVGREVMKTSGRVWILSRMSVFMERRPRFGETITVRSWPRGTSTIFAVRDYDIRDAGDNIIIRGRSGWLILDMEKRRPLRPQAVVEALPPNEGLDSLPGTSAGSAAPSGLHPAFAEYTPDSPHVFHTTRTARYSDIDYNGHVNNTRYIQWIQDLFDPPAILENARSMRIDINYLSEVKSGETVELFLGPVTYAEARKYYPDPLSPAFAIEGRRNGEAVFRAELCTGIS
ncbi:MAG: acyl-ACP thioesterase [Treponema sp.]|jgi:acyl-ACP thioesterase|nr:acyl-ACP thioesterase [Treponema sp.]